MARLGYMVNVDLSIPPHQWSKSSLNKLGNALISEAPLDEEDTKLFTDFRQWSISYVHDLKELLSEVTPSIVSERPQGWDPHHIHGAFHVSGRAKTLPTLQQKLRRKKLAKVGAHLSRVGDVVGVRVDFNGGLVAQDHLAERLTERLKFAGATAIKKIDRRLHPMAGYRALHLEVIAPRGLAEIQLRTSVQAEWANTFEKFADVVGRKVRYDDSLELPAQFEGIRGALLNLSEQWHLAEESLDAALGSLMKVSDALAHLNSEERLDQIELMVQELPETFRNVRVEIPNRRNIIINNLRDIQVNLMSINGKES